MAPRQARGASVRLTWDPDTADHDGGDDCDGALPVKRQASMAARLSSLSRALFTTTAAAAPRARSRRETAAAAATRSRAQSSSSAMTASTTTTLSPPLAKYRLDAAAASDDYCDTRHLASGSLVEGIQGTRALNVNQRG